MHQNDAEWPIGGGDVRHLRSRRFLRWIAFPKQRVAPRGVIKIRPLRGRTGVVAFIRHPSAITHSINYQPSTINHQPSTINHQLSPINYQLSTINYQLSTINYHPSTIPHQLSTTNYQPSTINHQPSTIKPILSSCRTPALGRVRCGPCRRKPWAGRRGR